MAPTAIATPETYAQSKHVEFNPVRGSQLPGSGKDIWRDLVLNILEERAAAINTDECQAGEEDAFFVADMGEVYRQHLRWKMNLRRVKPFFGESYRRYSYIVLC